MRKMKWALMMSIQVLVFLLLLGWASLATAQSPSHVIESRISCCNQVLSSDVTVTVTVQSSTEIGNGVDDKGPQLNGADPNYVPTEAELKLLAEKEARARQYMLQVLSAELNGPMASTLHLLNVGTSGQWREPDDMAHVNYCGPGATQVALDARLPAASVPNIDTIGADENIDPNNGVTTRAVKDELNRLLGANYYGVSGAASRDDLASRIMIDVDDGFAMVTALMTGGMPGWNRDVRHIVAVYGYASGNPIRAYYVETAAPTAGFTGIYFNNKSTTGFWTWVQRNNSQVW